MSSGTRENQSGRSWSSANGSDIEVLNVDEEQTGKVPTCNKTGNPRDVYGALNTNHRYPTSNLHEQQQQPQAHNLGENYTVYPVGHGNYLKIYHCKENEPQSFNNYELFSSNTLIASNLPSSTLSSTSLSSPPLSQLLQNKSGNDVFDSSQIQFNTGNNVNNEATTNLIINQLVTNWSPNLSGTYSPFGEQLQSSSGSVFTNEGGNLLKEKNSNSSPPHSASLHMTNTPIAITATRPNSKSFGQQNTNGSFENNTNSLQSPPEVKKRIVAEVKPMRLSYSDVLTKNVNVNSPQNSNSGANSNGNSKQQINAVHQSQDNTNSAKISKSSKDKTYHGNNIYSVSERKSTFDEKDALRVDGKHKRQDTQGYKSEEIFIGQNNNIPNQKDKKKSTSIDDKNSSSNKNASATMSKNGKKQNIFDGNAKNKMKTDGGNSAGGKKRSKRDIDEKNSSIPLRNSQNDPKEYFYNITKSNEGNYDRYQKIPQNQHQQQQQQYTSSKKKHLNPVQKGGYRQDARQSYSSSSSSVKKGQRQQRDLKYELFIKFLEKWFEYTLKILSWLFYLVYDIVVLGFSMVMDHVHISYVNTYAFIVNLHYDLKNNSGKPSTWIRNLLKKFDSKFKKNSKFAFWRTFFKKKQNEPSRDFYKNGRLPQTGDEAMYSLLNCKGKDAYSILGVSADSSQEQIRKHYKKIAVLVHPDKNKQPGAEEAFKVLQRAFELIGEPENRKSYDQSLAEALNAEKAWTELHDLLSQLQSKIAEAANTIRCSSCGLRHPRKLTERPHYAARECSSCKISHSAREGDIWAETSILGLRWKYYALMEGKVYDITEWANCQKGALSHLQPNSHVVQYRIVRGGQQQQQQQNQQQQQQQYEKERSSKREPPPCEPSLDDFLDNLYSGQNPQNQHQQNATRRRSKRN